MVKKLRLWAHLGAQAIAAILALPCTIQQVAPGKYLAREGDRAKHCCLLLDGYAFRHKIVGDGSRAICSMHMRGDIVDLQNSLLGEADHSVQTLTHSLVASIPREAIVEIAVAHPKVGMAMWYDTLVDASIFREWIANVGRRDAATRVAHLLCEFGLRREVADIGDRHNYELPMSQEQLADATGLTAVHVNRTLKALEADDLIRRTVRSIAVVDWARLQQAGDFSSAYLHLRGSDLLQ